MKVRCKGGWYNEVWNPITGTPNAVIKPHIMNHCRRFSGDVRVNMGRKELYDEVEPGYFELKKPVKSPSSDRHFLISPFGTVPTLHRYRLTMPENKYITGRNLFVNGFADTFEMPNHWINEVMLIIERNPHHNFILISDSFRAMLEYVESFNSILGDNLWLGFQVTKTTATRLCQINLSEHQCHFFLAVDEVTVETISILEKFINKSNVAADQIDWILVTEKMMICSCYNAGVQLIKF